MDEELEEQIRAWIKEIIDEISTTDNTGAYSSKYFLEPEGEESNISSGSKQVSGSEFEYAIGKGALNIGMEENNKNGDINMSDDIKDINDHFRKQLVEYMDNTDFDEKYPYQQVSISVKSVRDELQDAEKVLKTAKEIKNNNNVTPSDYWKWTPQHIDEIVEKLRSLISLVQSLKR